MTCRVWRCHFEVEIIGRHVHLISDKTTNYDTSERQKRDKMARTTRESVTRPQAAHAALGTCFGTSRKILTLILTSNICRLIIFMKITRGFSQNAEKGEPFAVFAEEMSSWPLPGPPLSTRAIKFGETVRDVALALT